MLPMAAKVFIRSSHHQIRLAEPSYEEVDRAVFAGDSIRGVTVDGKPVTIPAGEITGVYGPSPKPVDTGIFNGRRVQVRAIRAHMADDPEFLGTQAGRFDDADLNHIVVVSAEDLMSVDAVWVDLRTGQPVWINPANCNEATRLYVAVAMLAARAESAQVAFDTQDLPGGVAGLPTTG